MIFPVRAVNGPPGIIIISSIKALSSSCTRTVPCLLWRIQTQTRRRAPAQTAAWMPEMSAGRRWYARELGRAT